MSLPSMFANTLRGPPFAFYDPIFTGAEETEHLFKAWYAVSYRETASLPIYLFMFGWVEGDEGSRISMVDPLETDAVLSQRCFM